MARRSAERGATTRNGAAAASAASLALASFGSRYTERPPIPRSAVRRCSCGRRPSTRGRTRFTNTSILVGAASIRSAAAPSPPPCRPPPHPPPPARGSCPNPDDSIGGCEAPTRENATRIKACVPDGERRPDVHDKTIGIGSCARKHCPHRRGIDAASRGGGGRQHDQRPAGGKKLLGEGGPRRGIQRGLAERHLSFTGPTSGCRGRGIQSAARHRNQLDSPPICLGKSAVINR